MVLVLSLCVPVLVAQPKAKQSLFINLTSDEIEWAAMAVNLAHRVLKEEKVPVTIWLNVEGVRLVYKEVLQNMYSGGRTPLEKLQAFMRDVKKALDLGANSCLDSASYV